MENIKDLSPKTIKENVIRTLRLQGYQVNNGRIEIPKEPSKEDLRRINRLAVAYRIQKAEPSLKRYEKKLLKYIANGEDINVQKVKPKLIYIKSGSNEELLFRGLFLRKYRPFIGRFLSNLVIAIPFALHHTGVSYSPGTLTFLALLLPLALAWGFVTQRTDSLWGAILFHAGTDIPVALSLFSALE